MTSRLTLWCLLVTSAMSSPASTPTRWRRGARRASQAAEADGRHRVLRVLAPNVARATAMLHPRGVAVVADDDQLPLPFADAAFDPVLSRHPVTTWWPETARVLRPRDTYLSQQVGPRSVSELVEQFLGPLPDDAGLVRDPFAAADRAWAVGLEVVDLQTATLRMEFHDIGSVVYFLRKVILIVPGSRSTVMRQSWRPFTSNWRKVPSSRTRHATRTWRDARRDRPWPAVLELGRATPRRRAR